MGRENFIPISSSPGKSRLFRHREYEPMIEALDRGKTLVIAGHNTAYVGQLEDRPGIGAAYLQAITGAAILPVAVDVKVKNPPDNSVRSYLKIFATFPGTTVSIGEPIIFDPIENFEDQMMARAVEEASSKESRIAASAARVAVVHEIRRRAGIIASAHAQLLPPEKKGKWGQS